MRLFNNTKYKTLEAQFIFDTIKHRLLALSEADYKNIESIEVNDKTINVTLHEDEDNRAKCIAFKVGRNTRVKGKIRWFNETSGEGVIRLDNGISVPFYACNVVGADSHYHFKVTNVHLTEGQDVTAVIPEDEYMFKELGLIKIRAV